MDIDSSFLSALLRIKDAINSEKEKCTKVNELPYINEFLDGIVEIIGKDFQLLVNSPRKEFSRKEFLLATRRVFNQFKILTGFYGNLHNNIDIDAKEKPYIAKADRVLHDIVQTGEGDEGIHVLDKEGKMYVSHVDDEHYLYWTETNIKEEEVFRLLCKDKRYNYVTKKLPIIEFPNYKWYFTEEELKKFKYFLCAEANPICRTLELQELFNGIAYDFVTNKMSSELNNAICIACNIPYIERGRTPHKTIEKLISTLIQEELVNNYPQITKYIEL